MQHWTKKKPDRPGYWWILIENEAFIKLIFFTKNGLFIDDEYMIVAVDDEKYYSTCLWGSSPICEPVGEKI